MLNNLSQLELGLLAISGAIALMVGFAAMLHWRQHHQHGLVTFIFYPLLLTVTLSVLLSGRNLSSPMDLSWLTAPKPSILVWLSRATSIFVMFAAAERLLSRAFFVGIKPPIATSLMLAFLLFSSTNIVIPAAFGAHPSISHDYVYPILVACSALLMSSKEGESAIRAARNALLIFLMLGAVTLLWRPEVVVMYGYSGLIPGINIRYSGLAMHPNGLGPLIAVFLLCLWHSPYVKPWFNRFAWILGVLSFLIAQSKTSWIAFLLCAVLMFYFSHRDAVLRRLLDFSKPVFPAVVIGLFILSSVVVAASIMFGGVDEKIADYFDSSAGAGLLTFMGRTQIWETAIDEWRNSPVFGYGLTIWNEEYRARIGIPEAYQAHNQFFQSLSSSGVLGAIGLLIYGVVLLVYSLKTARGSKGLSCSLCLLILTGSFSEVPLAINGMGPEQLSHFLLLMVIAGQYQSQRQVLPIFNKRREVHNAPHPV